MQHTKPIVMISCCLLAAGVATSAWAIGITPPTWKSRELVAGTAIDPDYFYHPGRVLAYDHHGNPGIAFCGDANDDLYFAWRVPDVGWASTAVDTPGFMGRYPSIAFDPYGGPGISYVDASNDDIRFAHFDGSTWQTETVDATPTFTYHTSLAYDLYGRAAISYLHQTSGHLYYAEDANGNGSFTDETPVMVSNVLGDGNASSLVFDPLNRPMISHLQFGQSLGPFRFSVREPGIGWVTTTVDNADTISFSSAAIDPDNGYPAIAYLDDGNDVLKYAAWNGVNWDIATVDDYVRQRGRGVSLAFDQADGNPAIAYRDDGNEALKLAWHDGSQWNTQTVDSVGDVGYEPTLAFNDFGRGYPSIAYFEDIDGASNLYFILPEPGSMTLLLLRGLLLGTWFSLRRRTVSLPAPGRRGQAFTLHFR